MAAATGRQQRPGWQFETLCRWADNARQKGDDALAETHYREALALYGEDFLAHELLTDWAEARRTHLRNCCVEAAYCRMMQLHARRGDGDRVRAVYADCCCALESQVDAAPSAKTLAVFEATIDGTAPFN
jgi:hypothetical protein